MDRVLLWGVSSEAPQISEMNYSSAAAFIDEFPLKVKNHAENWR